MAYPSAPLVHAGAVGTTPARDTTGATLIVLMSCHDNSGQNVSDSKSNTWTPLTGQTHGSDTYGRLYYCVNPSVGSGHTFTSGVGYGAILMQAWSNNAVSPFDQQNGTPSGGATSLQPGSITPTEANELVIVGLGTGNSTSLYGVDGGFTISDSVNAVAFSNYGGSLAYLVQTSAAAANPTYSWTGSATAANVIASFKAAAGGGGATWPGYQSPFGWH